MFEFLTGRPGRARKSRRTVAVLGASGGVGKRVVRRALDRGFELRCQTRDADRLAEFGDRIRVDAFEPSTERAALEAFVQGADAVVFALGIGVGAPTTFFSRATDALVAAMSKSGVRRLVAVTCVGVGETRGHGGFFHDRIVHPLFRRHRCADMERQEESIAASGLDWVVVRPAAFSEGRAKAPLEVVTEIAPDLVLRRVSRDEVADFVVEQLQSDRYLRQRPFIGRP